MGSDTATMIIMFGQSEVELCLRKRHSRAELPRLCPVERQCPFEFR
jgi:hypothetical protein